MVDFKCYLSVFNSGDKFLLQNEIIFLQSDRIL